MKKYGASKFRRLVKPLDLMPLSGVFYPTFRGVVQPMIAYHAARPKSIILVM